MGLKKYFFAATQAACIGQSFQFAPKTHTRKKGAGTRPNYSDFFV